MVRVGRGKVSVSDQYVRKQLILSFRMNIDIPTMIGIAAIVAVSLFALTGPAEAQEEAEVVTGSTFCEVVRGSTFCEVVRGKIHYVAYTDTGVGRVSKDIFFDKFEEGKSRLDPPDPINLSRSTGASFHPGMVVSENGNMVTVVWVERLLGSREILARTSNDFGDTFFSKINVSETGGGSLIPEITRGSDGNLYVTWWESAVDVHISASVDGGISFAGSPNVTPSDPSDPKADLPARSPRIGMDPSVPGVVVRWQEIPRGIAEERPDRPERSMSVALKERDVNHAVYEDETRRKFAVFGLPQWVPAQPPGPHADDVTTMAPLYRGIVIDPPTLVPRPQGEIEVWSGLIGLKTGSSVELFDPSSLASTPVRETWVVKDYPTTSESSFNRVIDGNDMDIIENFETGAGSVEVKYKIREGEMLRHEVRLSPAISTSIPYTIVQEWNITTEDIDNIRIRLQGDDESKTIEEFCTWAVGAGGESAQPAGCRLPRTESTEQKMQSVELYLADQPLIAEYTKFGSDLENTPIPEDMFEALIVTRSGDSANFAFEYRLSSENSFTIDPATCTYTNYCVVKDDSTVILPAVSGSDPTCAGTISQSKTDSLSRIRRTDSCGVTSDWRMRPYIEWEITASSDLDQNDDVTNVTLQLRVDSVSTPRNCSVSSMTQRDGPISFPRPLSWTIASDLFSEISNGAYFENRNWCTDDFSWQTLDLTAWYDAALPDPQPRPEEDLEAILDWVAANPGQTKWFAVGLKFTDEATTGDAVSNVKPKGSGYNPRMTVTYTPG